MCGIFAYSGSGDVPQILVEGLKKLEYRGYDSSGLAFFSSGNRIKCVKACGGVSELEKLLSDKISNKKKQSPPAVACLSAPSFPPSPDKILFAEKAGDAGFLKEQEKKLSSGKKSEHSVFSNKKSIAEKSVSAVKNAATAGSVPPAGPPPSARAETNRVGMGHTRWATHGAPTRKNAHPHRAGPIYVVHNGVIENEGELRELVDTRSLISETDTELLAHLLFRFYREEKGDLIKSVFKTMDCLKGSYAVTALCEEKPGEIIAFKQGPPLALCRGAGDFVISSDIYSVGKSIKETVFLEDGEAVFLKDQTFQIYSGPKAGDRVHRAFRPVQKEGALPDKKKFPHFMLKEIFEQPATAQKVLESAIDRDKVRLNLKPAGGDQKTFNSLIEKAGSVRIVACGSSYFAGLFAKYLLEEFAGLSAVAETAGEFIYRKTVFSKSAPVLFISQSGETADILTALNRVKKQGMKTISLCNVPGSGLDRRTDYRFYLRAGPEVGVAGTKSFTNSLISLILLALHCGKVRKTLSPGEEKRLMTALLQLPSCMERVLGCEDFFLKSAKTFKKFSGWLYLGRGLFYPIALEGALKLKEIAYISAEGFPAGEMKHGPLALIDKTRAVTALLPSTGVLRDKTLINLKEARTRGAFIMGLGGKDTPELKKLCDRHLPLPDLPDFLSAVLAVIPLQLMAYYVSRSFGYNADRPRNLAKSVTVE